MQIRIRPLSECLILQQRPKFRLRISNFTLTSFLFVIIRALLARQKLCKRRSLACTSKMQRMTNLLLINYNLTPSLARNHKQLNGPNSMSSSLITLKRYPELRLLLKQLLNRYFCLNYLWCLLTTWIFPCQKSQNSRWHKLSSHTNFPSHYRLHTTRQACLLRKVT